MKKRTVILVLAVLAIVFLLAYFLYTGFILPLTKDYPITLHHDPARISEVELIQHYNKEDEEVKTVSAEKIPELIDELLTIKRHRRFAPVGEYGDLVVKIYYDNNDTEIIGNDAYGFASTENSEFEGWYYIDDEAFAELFNRYLIRSA